MMKQSAYLLLLVVLIISGCSEEKSSTEPENKKPSCTITSPANNDTITKGEDVTILVDADDSDGTLNGVRFLIDGTGAGSDNEYPYDFIFKTDTCTKETYTFKAVAEDNDGAEGTDNVTINIKKPENTAPLCKITAPANNSAHNKGSDITILAEASDKEGSVENVDLYIDNKLFSTDNTSPYSFVFKTDTCTKNSYEIKAVAIDESNLKTSDSVKVSINIIANQPPECKITSPETNETFKPGEDIKFEVNASDPDGNLFEVRFYIDGKGMGADKDFPYEFTFNTDTCTKETYTFKAVAEDDEGSEASDEFTVNITFPEYFYKKFGGDQHDVGYVVEQTTDKGYIIAGKNVNIDDGTKSLWLIKTDRTGKKVWEKTFETDDMNIATDICKVSDGGYIITCVTADKSNENLVIKVNENGNKEWEYSIKSYHIFSAEQENDNYIVFANIESKATIIRLDSEGNELSKVYFAIDPVSDIKKPYCKTADNCYVLIGYEPDLEYSSSIIIKADSEGNTLWQKKTKCDEPGYIYEADNEYIVYGYSGIANEKYYLIEKASDSEHGVLISHIDNSYYLFILTSDNGYMAAGKDLMKLSPDYETEWIKGSFQYYGDFIHHIQQTSDNGYIITGKTGSFVKPDLILIRTDENGNYSR